MSGGVLLGLKKKWTKTDLASLLTTIDLPQPQHSRMLGEITESLTPSRPPLHFSPLLSSSIIKPWWLFSIRLMSKKKNLTAITNVGQNASKKPSRKWQNLVDFYDWRFLRCLDLHSTTWQLFFLLATGRNRSGR